MAESSAIGHDDNAARCRTGRRAAGHGFGRHALAADHPLDELSDARLWIRGLKRHERPLLAEAHVYLAFGSCACDLTLDGAGEEDKAKRQVMLDDFEAFLITATKQGPVHALVTDGDRRTPPKELAVSVPEFRDFDFDSAWDAPTRLTITSGQSRYVARSQPWPRPSRA